MIRDLLGHTHKEISEADVLVVGAGTVGLVVATELAKSGLRVIVLESGGLRQDEDEHPLNAMVQIGANYPGAARGRFRCLGGTSTRWGGALIPFLAADMDSGLWPVSHAEITSYLPRVEQLFQLPPGPYDWDGLTARGDGKAPDYIARLAKWPAFAKRNVANLLSQEIANTENPVIWLNATATHFEVGENGRLVKVVATAPDSAQISVCANEVVIAAGAIESTRLLLLADRQNGGKFFAPDDVLGRYFHDHLSAPVAGLQVHDRNALNRIVGFRFEGDGMRNVRFELSERSPHRKIVPDCFAHIAFQEQQRGGFDALRDLFRQLQQRRYPKLSTLVELTKSLPWLMRATWWRFVEKRLLYPSAADIQLHMVIEQIPRPENRIFLSDDRRGRDGQPLAVIDWTVGRQDEENLTRATDLFIDCWRGSALAPLADILRRSAGEAEAELALGGSAFHPGGTTRMARSPHDGVVDRDLRAFHVPNLRVLSTSTFPSGGGANPTMMLMMFALRLADDIARGSAGLEARPERVVSTVKHAHAS